MIAVTNRNKINNLHFLTFILPLVLQNIFWYFLVFLVFTFSILILFWLLGLLINNQLSLSQLVDEAKDNKDMGLFVSHAIRSLTLTEMRNELVG